MHHPLRSQPGRHHRLPPERQPHQRQRRRVHPAAAEQLPSPELNGVRQLPGRVRGQHGRHVVEGQGLPAVRADTDPQRSRVVVVRAETQPAEQQRSRAEN